MSHDTDDERLPGKPAAAQRADDNKTARDEPPAASMRPVEIGGRDGLDPTRYGDWEKGGRCIDF